MGKYVDNEELPNKEDEDDDDEEDQLKKDRGDILDDEDEDDEDEDDSDEDDSDEDDDSEDEDDSDDDSGEDEDEDDSDEDEDDSEEDDSGEEDGDSEDDQRVPRSRLNQVIKQREDERERTLWLEEQLEKLISSQTKKEDSPKTVLPKYDFTEKEAEYIDHVLAGETQKAVSLRKEIDDNKQLLFEKQLEKTNKAVREETLKEVGDTQEQRDFDNAIELFEKKYPFLNSESEEFNEEAVESINVLMAGYVSKGMGQAKALSSAIEKMVPFFVKEDTTPKKKNTDVEKKKREVKGRKRNAKASRQQPPKSSSKRSGSRDVETLDISKMSERQFSKLTSKEKKILRGD